MLLFHVSSFAFYIVLSKMFLIINKLINCGLSLLLFVNKSYMKLMNMSIKKLFLQFLCFLFTGHAKTWHFISVWIQGHVLPKLNFSISVMQLFCLLLECLWQYLTKVQKLYVVLLYNMHLQIDLCRDTLNWIDVFIWWTRDYIYIKVAYVKSVMQCK